jgi:hypothetical protein
VAAGASSRLGRGTGHAGALPGGGAGGLVVRGATRSWITAAPVARQVLPAAAEAPRAAAALGSAPKAASPIRSDRGAAAGREVSAAVEAGTAAAPAARTALRPSRSARRWPRRRRAIAYGGLTLVGTPSRGRSSHHRA